MNKTHYILFFDITGEILITTTPRNWNRANPDHLNNHEARTRAIEDYLQNNYGFERAENDRAVIYYNWDVNIQPHNGISFY